MGRHVRKRIAEEQAKRAAQRIKDRLEELQAKPMESLTQLEAAEVIYLLSRELNAVEMELERRKEHARRIIKAYKDAAPKIEEFKKFLEDK